MANEQLKATAKAVGVPLWLVGERAYNGMSDANFSRKLRHELPSDETNRILKIIDQLAEERRVEA